MGGTGWLLAFPDCPGSSWLPLSCCAAIYSCSSTATYLFSVAHPEKGEAREGLHNCSSPGFLVPPPHLTPIRQRCSLNQADFFSPINCVEHPCLLDVQEGCRQGRDYKTCKAKTAPSLKRGWFTKLRESGTLKGLVSLNLNNKVLSPDTAEAQNSLQ